MSEQKTNSATTKPFPLTTVVCISLAFLLWSSCCYLIATKPQSFDSPSFRIIGRILSVLIPALVFKIWIVTTKRSQTSDSKSTAQECFSFHHRWILGVCAGFLVAATYLGVMYFDPIQKQLSLPADWATWLGVIVGPMTEEMLFRAILAAQIVAISQSLDGAKGWDSWIAGVILSAAIFAAFHLPGWLIDETFAVELIVRLAKEFGFGCVLGILFLATRSIWASLIPHWAYDFFARLLD